VIIILGDGEEPEELRTTGIGIAGVARVVLGLGMASGCAGGVADGSAGKPTTISLAGGLFLPSPRLQASSSAAFVGVVDASEKALGKPLTLLATTTSGANGGFGFAALAVQDDLGLVLLTDDASSAAGFDAAVAAGGDYFPALVAVRNYLPGLAEPATERADIGDAAAVLLPTALVDAWQGLPGLETLKVTGFAVGLVVDGATGKPLRDATLSASVVHVTIDVTYVPDAAGTSLMATDSSGLFISNDLDLVRPTREKLLAGELTLRAEVPGYACMDRVMAIAPRLAFFALFTCVAR